MAIDSIVIRNASVGNSNFTGISRDPKDREGNRYIIVRLEPDVAEELIENGWNVKKTKPRSAEYESYPYIKVKINLDGYYYHGLRKTSKVYMVTKNNRTLLDENTLKELEGCYFEKVDLRINHIYYKSFDQWSIVLESGFFTIQPDELYDEYFNNGPETESVDDEDDIPFM